MQQSIWLHYFGIISKVVISKMSTTSELEVLSPQYRQIRALYDDESITVYQAYSAEIALPAIAEQNLAASPAFQYDRMTWIKPSFMWMM